MHSTFFQKLTAIRAFRSMNYRLYYIGQTVSVIGNFVQATASGWLLYRLTNTPIYLGLAFFCSNLPPVFLSPFAGVLADRMQRQKILQITQVLLMTITFLLAWLVLSSKIMPWHILSINFMLGIVNAFDMPGRNTFVYDILEHKEDLNNAVALNALMFNGSRIIGPAFAGFLISKYGEGLCFLFNGLSYTIIIFVLFLIKIQGYKQTVTEGSVLQNLQDGIKYAISNISIKTLLIFISITSLSTMPLIALMPVFAKDVFKGGADTLGMFMGLIGVGAVISAISLASKKKVEGIETVMFCGAFGFAIFLSIFAWSSNINLSRIIAIMAGASMILMYSGCNTLIQTIVEPTKRGRIMSLYTTAFIGSIPLGSILCGWLAHHLGVSVTCQLMAIICSIGGLLIYLNRKKILNDLQDSLLRQNAILSEK